MRLICINKYGVRTLDSSSEQAYLGTYEEISDWNHPGFDLRSESGEVVIGSLSLSRSVSTITEGSIVFPDGDSIISINGDMYDAFRPVNSPDHPNRNSRIQSCKDRAAISALKKLNIAEMDTGEVLATMAQTVGMLRRPFHRMSKLLSKMEKGRSKCLYKKSGGSTSQDYLKATTDTWLEYSFGWRPLFQDIGTIGKTFAKDVQLFETALRVARGGSEDSLTATASGSYIHGGENLYSGMKAVGTATRMTNLKVGTGVYYRIPMGMRSDFVARTLGLGVSNIPTTIWNLTPYSWVVDQVVNVGDWISALTPDPDLQIIGKWMTLVEKSVVSGSCDLSIYRSPQVNVNQWYSGSGGGKTDTVTSVTRVTDFDLPSSPQFAPYLGGIGLALSDAAFGLQFVSKMLQRWAH